MTPTERNSSLMPTSYLIRGLSHRQVHPARRGRGVRSHTFGKRFTQLVCFLSLISSFACLGGAQVEYDPSWQHPSNWHSWLDEDVRALVTSQERVVFLRLRTDADRQEFANRVWRAYDPSSHYERLQYANKQFQSNGLAGAQSDRGLVYVRFGAPARIEKAVSAANPSVKTEAWFYRSGFSFFFTNAKSGEYILMAGEFGTKEKILDLDPKSGRCCGTSVTPQPEPPNEFNGGPPTNECRCKSAGKSSETLNAAESGRYIEAFYSPLTSNTAVITLLLSRRKSWYDKKREATNEAIEFRGTVVTQAGKSIIRFDDRWLPNDSPDSALPLNRCEEIFLSEGSYQINVDVLDLSKNTKLSQCSVSLNVPDPAKHNSLFIGSDVCH